MKLLNTPINCIYYSILNWDFDRFELTSKINSLLAFDVTRIKAATDDIEASLNHLEKNSKKMERSSIENYEGYLRSKSDLNEEKQIRL